VGVTGLAECFGVVLWDHDDGGGTAFCSCSDHEAHLAARLRAFDARCRAGEDFEAFGGDWFATFFAVSHCLLSCVWVVPTQMLQDESPR